MVCKNLSFQYFFSLPPENVKRSPPARANSMPPRPNRPQVLKKINSEPKETYSVNGINYTTYTTFRSPLTPDDIPPQIPEPDYEPQESKTLERIKKKKSVSFVEDISRKETDTVKKVPKKNPESILKDTSSTTASSATPPTHCQHGRPILRPALVGDKYMQPIERIPRLKMNASSSSSSSTSGSTSSAPITNGNGSLDQQALMPINTINSQKTVVRVMPEDKIRIEVPSTSTISLNRSNRYVYV